MLERVEHAADVRLRDGIATLTQTRCELALREAGVPVLEHVLEFRHGEGPLDERQLAMQVALGQVPEQGMRFRLPRAEQAMDTEEPLFACFLPQLTEDA
ncbi:hypothetical protein D3C77_272270 [compost metagenome]